MQIKTAVYDYEIQEIFNQFKHYVPETNWCKRVRKLNDEAKGNELLQRHHFDENRIAYGLNACSEVEKKYGVLPLNLLDLNFIYPAIAFASHALSVINLMESHNKKCMLGRVAGAFRHPEDIRALELEFTTAHHFSKSGYRLEWPEISGKGTFDLFVADLGPKGLEIECKSISDDKGKCITKREALDFFKILSPLLKPFLRNLNGGLSVVLTLPSKLPNQFHDRKDLAKKVFNAIITNNNNNPEFMIKVRSFPPKLLFSTNENSDPKKFRETINLITETSNQQAIVMGKTGTNALCFVIQSSEDDSLFESLKTTAKRAVDTQLTKTRPGLLLVEFNGLTAIEMQNLAQQDKAPGNTPTMLRKWASAFLSNSTTRNHLIGIGFISAGQMQKANNEVLSGSTAYLFSRKESPFWDNAFNGLFSES